MGANIVLLIHFLYLITLVTSYIADYMVYQGSVQFSINFLYWQTDKLFGSTVYLITLVLWILQYINRQKMYY